MQIYICDCFRIKKLKKKILSENNAKNFQTKLVIIIIKT